MENNPPKQTLQFYSISREKLSISRCRVLLAIICILLADTPFLLAIRPAGYWSEQRSTGRHAFIKVIFKNQI